MKRSADLNENPKKKAKLSTMRTKEPCPEKEEPYPRTVFKGMAGTSEKSKTSQLNHRDKIAHKKGKKRNH